ncbi:hypothetical protein Tco_1106679 [Tanacetum coccineum]
MRPSKLRLLGDLCIKKVGCFKTQMWVEVGKGRGIRNMKITHKLRLLGSEYEDDYGAIMCLMAQIAMRCIILLKPLKEGQSDRSRKGMLNRNQSNSSLAVKQVNFEPLNHICSPIFRRGGVGGCSADDRLW